MTDADRINDLLRTADRIEHKVDKVDDKLDGHGEMLARHDTRIATLERNGQHQWERFVLWITILGALAAALVPHFVH